MRIEFRPITPTPPTREVVITLSVADAKTLHNQLYQLRPASPAKYTVVDDLIEALTASGVQKT